MTLLILRFLHFLMAALWFGAGLTMPGDVKRSIAAGPEHWPLLRQRIGRSARILTSAGIGTLLTGVVMIVSLGGFGVVPVPIHISLLLGLIMAVLGAVGLAGTWSRIEAEMDGAASAEALAALGKRMAMMAGIHHGLWTVILVLMVFRHGF